MSAIAKEDLLEEIETFKESVDNYGIHADAVPTWESWERLEEIVMTIEHNRELSEIIE